MSLSKGIELFNLGLFQEAIQEFQKIPESSPLYRQAKFNIQLTERKLKTTPAVHLSAENTPLIQSAIPTSQDNSQQPLVSIVMPVFNVAPYLDASIMSVLNQSYSNIELIIVNDASTDNSLNIINMYAKQDARIRLINLEFNTLGGAGIPSNIGIDQTKGKYLAFADSDDILDKFAIEKMVASAEQLGSDVVIADFCTFNDETREITPGYDKDRWEKLPINTIFSPKDHPEVFTLSPVPWRKLYKISYLTQFHIRFPEGDYFYEDNPLQWYVLTNTSKVSMLDYPVAYHRLERTGQTMSSASYKLAAQFCHLDSIKCHLLEHKASTIFWKELVDFCYRANWIVEKQDDPKIKNLMKKRYAQTCLNSAKQSKLNKEEISKLRPSFYPRCEEYNQAYSDKDLAIVIPVFNCADLLPELLKDIEKIKLSKEIFLMDDGSTDGSTEICSQFAQDKSNVFFFSQSNKGAGVARNAIIPLISAKYTYFVDADDKIDSNNLEAAVKAADAAGNDLYFIPYKIQLYEKNTTRGMWNADQNIWQKAQNSSDPSDRQILVSQLINYPWIRIIQTRLLQDERIFFGKTIVHNDIPYHWHSIIAAKNIGISSQPVCTHRKFEQREQITNISDQRRLMVFEAYRYTHTLLKHYPKQYPKIFPYWQKFIRDLLTWARDRVPEEQQAFYRKRHKIIIDYLIQEAERIKA